MTTRVPPAVLLDALTPPAPLPTWTGDPERYLAALTEWERTERRRSTTAQVVELIHTHDQRQRDREAER